MHKRYSTYLVISVVIIVMCLFICLVAKVLANLVKINQAIVINKLILWHQLLLLHFANCFKNYLIWLLHENALIHITNLLMWP